MANEDFIMHDPTEIVRFNFNVDWWFQLREQEWQLLLSKTQRIDFSWPAPFCAHKLFLCGNLDSLGNEPTFSHTEISVICVCNLPLHSLAVVSRNSQTHLRPEHISHKFPHQGCYGCKLPILLREVSIEKPPDSWYKTVRTRFITFPWHEKKKTSR
jgi:hypothetical protein